MMPSIETTSQFRRPPTKLIVRIAISGLAPLVLYALLRPLLNNDAVALAIVGGISALLIVTLWIWRRRVEWIGLLSIFSFAVACLLTVLSSGSSLALELHGAVVASVIGLAFLISVIAGKPPLILLPRLFAHSDSSMANALESRASDPAKRKRLTYLSAAIGLGFFAKALVDLILALSLPTASFLATSKLVNWTLLAGGAALLWWISRHTLPPNPQNDRSNVRHSSQE